MLVCDSEKASLYGGMIINTKVKGVSGKLKLDKTSRYIFFAHSKIREGYKIAFVPDEHDFLELKGFIDNRSNEVFIPQLDDYVSYLGEKCCK